MRVFLLLQTPLSDIGNLSTPPGSEDIVCYIRHSQDPMRDAAISLKQQNITVYLLDEILSEETNNQIDEIGARFLKEWFFDGETDFSDVGDLSLGVSYSTELAREISPRVLIRTGEALRKLLEMHPEARGVYSDAKDGMGVYEVSRSFYPVAKTIEHVAAVMGQKTSFMNPIAPIPPALKLGNRNSFSTIVRSYFGRFRLSWLRAHFAFKKIRLTPISKPILYSFVGRAQDLVIGELVARQNFHVVCNRLRIPGTNALRSDHLFALPTIQDLRNVWDLLKNINNHSDPMDGDERYVFAGIKYDEILYHAVYEVLNSQIWAFLIIIAQSRKFQNIAGVSALLINDATNEPMGNLVSFNRDTELKIYLLPHGMNVTKRSFFAPSVDHTHVTYLAYGEDHAGFYRAYLDESKNLKRSLVGSPLTMLMNDICDKRPSAHGKRLLILTFGHTQFWNSARVFAADQYYIDIFSILPKLIDEGWRISLRSHPGASHEMENLLIGAFGISDSISWNNAPTINEALVAHDVVVGNVSTAYYQSLYAGWPTIFYEPDYRNKGGIDGIETDPMMTGLLTAKDLDRPVTNDPYTLASMIRDSLDPDSMVSKFPARFAGELAPRFIGPDPANSDKIIADFIEKDFFGTCSLPDDLAKTEAV